MERITGRQRETTARLRVVLQVLQKRIGQVQLLPRQDRELLSLVVVELAGVHGEAYLEGPVEHVWLGEAEQQVALQVPDACLDLQGFAESQKVVGGVSDADKRARQAAHAAGQADSILSLFPDFQREIDGTVLLIKMTIGGHRVIGLELFEVSELVQAEKTELPKT